jgi:hypothetical protein
MKITFQVQASELYKALDAVSVVKPASGLPKGAAGYLFVVKGDQCSIHSRNLSHMARTSLKVEVLPDGDAEGSFLYPADYIGGFKYLGDDVVEITATDKDNNYSVSYTSMSQANVVHPTVDHRLLTPIDKDLENAASETTYPVLLLKEALRVSQTFVLPESQEENGTVHLFDSSTEEQKEGNGCLYASNGTSACYFKTDALKDKGLTAHANSLAGISEFLSWCTSEVIVRTGPKGTFLINEQGWVFGWSHPTKTYSKYMYYSPSMDKIVCTISALTALNVLSYLECELPKDTRRVKVEYSDNPKKLVFSAAESDHRVVGFPVPVEGESTESLTLYVNIDRFKDLFQGAKGKDLQMRFFPHAGSTKSKAKVLIRTIDEFILDKEGKLVGGSGTDQPEGTHRCMVTRFMMSMA